MKAINFLLGVACLIMALIYIITDHYDRATYFAVMALLCRYESDRE